MSERTPEQIRAVGQAKMRRDSAVRTPVERQYVARQNLDLDGLKELKELVELVATDRGLRKTVDMDGGPKPNKFFSVTTEGEVLTVRAIEEVQQDISDEVSGVCMVSDNEYLDFSDGDLQEVRRIFRL